MCAINIFNINIKGWRRLEIQQKFTKYNKEPNKNSPTKISVQFNSVQLLSHVRLFATPWIAARQASLSITNSWSSLKLRSIESVMLSSHLILCRLLFLLPPIPPSIRVFSNETTLRLRWPKYWSFSFSIIPSKEIPGLIFFRMDWLLLLLVFLLLLSSVYLRILWICNHFVSWIYKSSFQLLQAGPIAILSSLITFMK